MTMISLQRGRKREKKTSSLEQLVLSTETQNKTFFFHETHRATVSVERRAQNEEEEKKFLGTLRQRRVLPESCSHIYVRLFLLQHVTNAGRCGVENVMQVSTVRVEKVLFSDSSSDTKGG